MDWSHTVTGTGDGLVTYSDRNWGWAGHIPPQFCPYIYIHNIHNDDTYVPPHPRPKYYNV